MSAEVVKLPLPAFRRWLVEHRDEVVGYRQNAACCPLASFGEFLYPECDIVVGPLNVNVTSDAGFYARPLEVWQRYFVRWIDDGNDGEVVLGSEALEVLVQVVKFFEEELLDRQIGGRVEMANIDRLYLLEQRIGGRWNEHES